MDGGASILEIVVQVLTVLSLTLGMLVIVGRWIVRSLEHRVKELTKPIQPDANGGSSLPDVARELKALAAANDRQHIRLHERVDVISDDVRDLQAWALDRAFPADDPAMRIRDRVKEREGRDGSR